MLRNTWKPFHNVRITDYLGLHFDNINLIPNYRILLIFSYVIMLKARIHIINKSIRR